MVVLVIARPCNGRGNLRRQRVKRPEIPTVASLLRDDRIALRIPQGIATATNVASQ